MSRKEAAPKTIVEIARSVLADYCWRRLEESIGKRCSQGSQREASMSEPAVSTAPAPNSGGVAESSAGGEPVTNSQQPTPSAPIVANTFAAFPPIQLFTSVAGWPTWQSSPAPSTITQLGAPPIQEMRRVAEPPRPLPPPRFWEAPTTEPGSRRIVLEDEAPAAAKCEEDGHG